MQWTVGRLAKRFGLSRSTLLYYDGIGLLRPQGRAAGEYRTYGEAEAARLERICLYRRAGLTLEQIKTVLDAPDPADTARTAVLTARLQALQQEQAGLRAQERLIAGLLHLPVAQVGAGRIGTIGSIDSIDKAAFTALLEAAGLSREDQRRFHQELEACNPAAHRRLLGLLGLDAEAVDAVLRWTRAGTAAEQEKE
ncbi:MerR family transcriptional regulator [Megalodesulfovibrio paquesii]